MRRTILIVLVLLIGGVILGARDRASAPSTNEARAAPVPPATEAARKHYAETLEDRFLREGFDVSVYAEGQSATTLRLRYVLMSRPMVYKLVNGNGLVPQALAAGFRRVVFADGYRASWVLNLATLKFE